MFKVITSNSSKDLEEQLNKLEVGWEVIGYSVVTLTGSPMVHYSVLLKYQGGVNLSTLYTYNHAGDDKKYVVTLNIPADEAQQTESTVSEIVEQNGEVTNG